MPEKRALIFDMDGVIVDSNAVHVEAWKIYNGRLGVEMTQEMEQRMFGKRNDQLVRSFLGESLTDEQVFEHGAAKEQLYRELIGRRLSVLLVPGLREFLELHRQMPKGIGSNAEPANVAFVLDGAQLRPYFDVVVDGHQVTNPKPHPEVYLRVSDLLGVPPERCMVFEDSYGGVQAGVAAGMQVVGISTTHDNLPGTAITVQNFESPVLSEWIRARMAE